MRKFFVLCFLTLLFSILHAETEWTVLIYMAADNNLSQQSFKDVNEMEMVPDNPNVTTLIQIDPNENTYYPPYFSSSRRYLIRYDDSPDSIGSELIADLGEINSADPKTLSDFANWGFSYAPSKKRMLIIWDHGNGWTKDDLVKSVCYDDYYNDRMSVAEGELRQAIEAIKDHIDIVVFDACLMQMAEVMTEIYEFCDIIAGSIFSVPADGIFYGAPIGTACAQYGLINYLFNNSDCTPEELADELVYRYINSYTTQCQYGSTVSFSAIRTALFPQFLSKMLSFTEIYSDSSYRQIYHDSRSQCLDFTYDYIDAYQFFDGVGYSQENDVEDAARGIASLIDSMTISYSAVYQNELVPDVGKMSINFPPELGAFSWVPYSNLLFRDSTRWDRFLSYYMDYYNENPYILDFHVSSISELVKFSWDVLATTDLSYKLYYKTVDETVYHLLADSSLAHDNSYSTTFPDGDYSFKLETKDEFNNSSFITEEQTVKKKSLFQFYPNPLITKEQEYGYFVVSTLYDEPSTIFIYNLNGDLVKTITIDDQSRGTHQIKFIPENVSSGVYFCLLRSDSNESTIKIAIIR